jgi:hypothetical protein
MRKWVRIALAALLIAVVGMVAWQMVRPDPHEPLYQGKRLGYWFRQYAKHSPQMSQATNAFWQMGERAVPYLAQVLEAPDPWGSWYLEAYNRWAQDQGQQPSRGLR